MSQVLSFKLKDNPPVRLRYALYIRNNDEYQVGKEIILTPWWSASGVLGPVKLLSIAGSPGCYTLHEDSNKQLKQLGYVPFAENIAVQTPEESGESGQHSHEHQNLEEGFDEVEDVLGRRLCKDMTYEYKV